MRTLERKIGEGMGECKVRRKVQVACRESARLDDSLFRTPTQSVEAIAASTADPSSLRTVEEGRDGR